MECTAAGYATNMRIVKVGTIGMPDRTFMLPGTDNHEPITTPVYCYLIEHERGLVLVDTGIANEGLGVVEKGQGVVEQLAQMGIETDRITCVVMTHMHLDHAAGMGALHNCKFIVRRSEWDMALNPTEREGGYVASHFDKLSRENVELIDGEKDFDLFSDGSIVLVSTRGHSAGHQSVLVRLKESGNFLIAGDAIYLRDNLDRNILPGYCTDEDAAYASMNKLRELEAAGCKILPGHDPAQERNLVLSPKAYL